LSTTRTLSGSSEAPEDVILYMICYEDGTCRLQHSGNTVQDITGYCSSHVGTVEISIGTKPTILKPVSINTSTVDVATGGQYESVSVSVRHALNTGIDSC
jgi:hypothetical protein